MKLQLFSAATDPFLRSLCIPGILGARKMRSLQRFSLNPCPSEPPTLYARPSSSWNLLQALIVFPDVSCGSPGGDRYTVLLRARLKGREAQGNFHCMTPMT